MEIARAYIRLAFAIEQHFPGYIDAYFGPEELKSNQKRPLAELAAEADELLRAVQRIEPPERRRWLARQVESMQATIALLQGEAMPYRQEVRRVYDIDPVQVPESRFEEASAALDGLLPGSGDINTRLNAFRNQFEVPKARVEEVLAVILERLGEKVRALYPLPEGESFEIRLVNNQPWGAYNWYLGHYRSRIDLNTDLPTYLNSLPATMAHEGYPGHHTEHVLKEQLLFHGQGRLEAGIFLLSSPESVMAEGIAVSAEEMVLAQEEQAALLLELAQFLKLPVGRPEIEAMQAINQQSEVLRYVSGNAALLLYEEGKGEEEVLAYLRHYALATPQRAKKSLEFLRHPSSRSYVYTYTVGGDLLDRLFAKGDKQAWFGRLLKEAITPGMVREWIEAA